MPAVQFTWFDREGGNHVGPPTINRRNFNVDWTNPQALLHIVDVNNVAGADPAWKNGFATTQRTGWFKGIKLTNLSILYTQQLNRRPDAVRQWLYIATPGRLRAGVEQMRTDALHFHMKHTRDAMSLFAATALRHGGTGRLWARPQHIEMCYGGWVRLEDLSDRFLLRANQGEKPLNRYFRPYAVNNL